MLPGDILILFFLGCLIVHYLYYRSGRAVIWESDCELKCFKVYSDGSAKRDFLQSLKCKDCSEKIRKNSEISRRVFGDSGLKFEFVENDTVVNMEHLAMLHENDDENQS